MKSYWSETLTRNNFLSQQINLSKNHVANLQWLTTNDVFITFGKGEAEDKRMATRYRRQVNEFTVCFIIVRSIANPICLGATNQVWRVVNLLSQGNLQYGIWFYALKLCIILKMISTKLIKTINNSNQFAYWVTRHTKRTNTGFSLLRRRRG